MYVEQEVMYFNVLDSVETPTAMCILELMEQANETT